MRKSFSIFQAGLFSILLFLIPTTILPQGFIRKPLRQCGFLKTETLREISIASDNVGILYIPLPDGLIKAVESKKLETIWQSDVGGDINSLIISGDSNLLVGTVTDISKKNEEQAKLKENEENGLPQKKLAIQSLSTATGVTRWKKAFSVSNDTERIYLLSDSKEKDLFVLSEKGKFLILNKESGEIKSEKNLNKTVSFPVLTADQKIYFGTDENKIFAASNLYSDISVTELAKLDNPPTALFTDDNGYLFAGDKTGIVYAFPPGNKKVKWKARSGAEITSVNEYSDKLLVSSSDNYIYFLSKNTGSRIWKKRLEGKIQGGLPIDKDSTIVSPFGTNTATVIDLKKGKTVNLVTVGDSVENSFTNNPFLIGRNVVFSTVGGLYSFSAEDCAGDN